MTFRQPSDEVRLRPQTVMMMGLCNSSHLILCPSRINNGLILPRLTTTRAPAHARGRRDGVHTCGVRTDGRTGGRACTAAGGSLILESVNRSSAVELLMHQRRTGRRRKRGRRRWRRRKRRRACRRRWSNEQEEERQPFARLFIYFSQPWQV